MTEARSGDTSVTGDSRLDWSAIWGGVFSFIAIWSVFGLLGTAIFASTANVNNTRPLDEMGLGIGIWIIVLTIIAMYVAGRVTTHLAGIENALDGAIQGMIMFGLSVSGALILAAFAEMTVGGTAATANAHNTYVLALFADLGWVGFASLFLGWLAAMGGAMGVQHSSPSHSAVQQVTHA